MEFRPELSWEFCSIDEITARTLRALRNHIRNVKECSAYYRAAFTSVNPDEIHSMDDFSALQCTERHHLAEQSSHFLGVAPGQIVETVLTAATTGKPLPFVLTQSDIDRIAFSYALSFHGVGMSSSDRVQLLLSLDRFSMDGMAHYRGGIMTGANVMRMGVGLTSPALVQKYLQFFRPTILIGSPSVFVAVAADLSKAGFDVATCKVQKILATSETIHTQSLQLNVSGNAIEKAWGAKVFSHYSSTECSVSYADCECRIGAHSHPELVYTEVVDSQGKPVPDGTIGELVATPLGVEGVPLVRYRTGDLTFRISGTCACGRQSTRIGPIIGKKTQPFVLGTTAIYPAMVTCALESIEEVKDFQMVIESDPRGADAATIHAAALPAALEKITHAIKSATGVHIPVLISNIPTIQAMRREMVKQSQVLDNRTRGAAKAEKTV